MTKDKMESLIEDVYLIQGQVQDLGSERVDSLQYEIHVIYDDIGKFAEKLKKELEGIVDDE